LNSIINYLPSKRQLTKPCGGYLKTIYVKYLLIGT
jgi:hypothetical protein